MDAREQSARDQNRRAWDALVSRNNRFTRPAKDEDFQNPLATVDGLNWLGDSIAGKRVLCLAAGGGRQGPLYAAAGADVTVVDISPAMLKLDRDVALGRNLHLKTVETSMDDLTMFGQGEFDIVIHPVSSCYLPDILGVYQNVARVTAAGGLYVSQHKQPTSLQGSITPSPSYQIVSSYYSKDPLPSVAGSSVREEGTMEFVHRWEELIGGLCRCGFVIEDLVEPMHADPSAAPGEFKHRSCFLAPYVRIKARRNQTSTESNSKLIL